MKRLLSMFLVGFGVEVYKITSVFAQTRQKATPLLPSGPSMTSLLGPFVIVILFGVLAYVFRRWVGKKSSFQSKGQIDVIAARQVAPHRSIQVIQVGGRNYLIGVGENIQLLSELPDELAPLPSEPAAQAKVNFQQLLVDYSTRLWRKR